MFESSVHRWPVFSSLGILPGGSWFFFLLRTTVQYPSVSVKPERRFGYDE